MPKFDIVSIGAATADIFVTSTGFKEFDGNISIPVSSKFEIDNYLITSGGGATNSSASFSRLGLKSASVSVLGQDFFGQVVLVDLKKYKVNQNLLYISRKEKTDFSVILVTKSGRRTIFTNRGQTSLESRHIDWKQLSQTKSLYITSLEGNLSLLEKLIGFCLDHSIKVFLNPGSREIKARKVLIPLLKHVEFLLLNEIESQDLVGKPFSHPDFISTLKSFRVPIVAITKGRHGAYIFYQDQKLFSPIVNTTPIDETGAGDSFGSAFVASYLYGNPPKTCLRWALKNSASVVSHIGAKPGLLTKSRIENN